MVCEEDHWMTRGRWTGLGTRTERPGWSGGERRPAWASVGLLEEGECVYSQCGNRVGRTWCRGEVRGRDSLMLETEPGNQGGGLR